MVESLFLLLWGCIYLCSFSFRSVTQYTFDYLQINFSMLGCRYCWSIPVFLFLRFSVFRSTPSGCSGSIILACMYNHIPASPAVYCYLKSQTLWPHICLFVHASVCLPACLSTCLLFCVSVLLFVNWSTCFLFYFRACLVFCFSAYWLFSLSVSLAGSLLICQAFGIAACPLFSLHSCRLFCLLSCFWFLRFVAQLHVSFSNLEFAR